MVAMRRREVVVWTYFKCRANRISWRIACGLVLKGRSSRRQGGAEERRAEVMKVMTILCHSKTSTKKWKGQRPVSLHKPWNWQNQRLSEITETEETILLCIKISNPWCYAREPALMVQPKVSNGSGNKGSPGGDIWEGVWLTHCSVVRMSSAFILKHQNKITITKLLNSNTKLPFPRLRIY